LLALSILVVWAALGIHFSDSLTTLSAPECLPRYILPDADATARELAESHQVSAQIIDSGWADIEGEIYIVVQYANGQQDGHPVCMVGDPQAPEVVIIHEGE